MFTRAVCCVLLLLFLSVGAMTINSSSGAAFLSVTTRPDEENPWWDNDWSHRARVFIDNHHNIEVLHDFPVQMHVPYRGGMQPDFDDLRFTDMDGIPLLYWIEEYVSSSYADVWVRVPIIPASMNIYLYYGNPDADSQSDIRGYAELSETFADDPIRSGGWIVYRHSGESSLEGCWDPQEEVLYLTRNATNLGVALFADVDMTQLSGWVLTFDYLVGGGTGAEGFCTMFYKDETPYTGSTPSCGGGLGFSTTDDDTIPGYGIEFDAHRENGDPCERHVALIENRTDSHLVYAEDDRVCDGSWHCVKLQNLRTGLILSLDSDTMFDYTFNVPVEDSGHGGFGFCAATGECTNDHVIDNVLLRKWTDPMPSTLVGEEEDQGSTIVATSFGQIKALFR
jgi:hypothetical protein